ncbi:hypothetical protein RMATCC62417_04822 [Rhizopus microsporus]|nr:hypothetical protein RMATCC62417_04822 [Rhizopus microsporus]
MSTVEPWAYPDHKQFERVPSLSEVDKTDRKAVYAARNQKIRDDWVKAMEARIIKEKLDECYRTEGVNHCKFFLFLSFFISLFIFLFFSRSKLPSFG